jgi:arylsulfatase A-like enzyme
VAVPQPNHIRCVREANWKYARYFDPAGVETSEYELYDLANDPDELHNLAGDPVYALEQERLAAKLAQLETTRLGWQVFLPALQN